MKLLFLVLILLPISLMAGPKDLRDAKKKASVFEPRARDFLKRQENRRKKQKDLRPVVQLLKRRRAIEKKHESARKKYVQVKKAKKRRGDRGFAKDLAEKKRQKKARRKELGDYVKGLKQIRSAKKRYRKKVDELEEVGLSGP